MFKEYKDFKGSESLDVTKRRTYLIHWFDRVDLACNKDGKLDNSDAVVDSGKPANCC